MAVVLQAAALLSHLETVDWRLSCGWRELKLDDQGVLRGARVEPWPDPEPAQRRLLGLVELLFGSRDRVVGKGRAKCLMSKVLARWHRWLDRLPADRIVTELLDETEFLWEPRFSSSRRALIAELSGGQETRVSVAGRGAFARRLMTRSGDREVLADLVAEQGARDLWSDCREVLSLGSSRLDRGRQLWSRGRWQGTLDVLAGSQKPIAQILRADCQWRLGRRAAARRLLDPLCSLGQPSTAESLEVTDLAVSLILDLGEVDRAKALLAQRKLAVPRRHGLVLDLLAAEVVARCGQWQLLSRRLLELEALREDPKWSWRWHRLRFWQACADSELRRAEVCAREVFAKGRRRIPKHESGRFWRQLAHVRLANGDLSGAATAGRHALRILEGVDERGAGSAARWQADLQVRQGRSKGMEALLRLEADPRPSRPGSTADPESSEIQGRMDLARGRPAAAYQRLQSTIERQDHACGEPPSRALVLAARALGWLGRGAEARELLDEAKDCGRDYLEPEELPALWALAGDWSKARELANADAVGRLWRSLLAGDELASADWVAVASLDAYRAARLIFDLQILMPGRVPGPWLERAGRAWRRLGAESFAERLDRTREGSWHALESYLRSASHRQGDLGDLFAAAGYFDIRLEWNHQEATQVLVPGKGGPEVLKAAKRGGQLVLSALRVDSVIRALFALAEREFEPDSHVAGRVISTRVRGILGESESLRKALLRLDRLASSEIPVLIQGETGTGKELAARQIHRLSSRSDHPLVTVNCAALSETLLLSDLFGHVRGAFTGAERDRIGVFESARGGTVLLDEIGDLPQAAQGKLLRVLQEGEVRRVGESLPRKIDIRVVAATHRELASMVDQKSFRADLFYRLKVGCLTLPPLRGRGRDVLLLADHFTGQSGYRLTSRARRRLMDHSWPGNVRELRNVLQVAMALSDGTTIDLLDLELPEGGKPTSLGYHQQVEEFRRNLVYEALESCEGRRSAAARRLSVSRQALSYLAQRFGL